jgi:hypothetical protein
LAAVLVDAAAGAGAGVLVADPLEVEEPELDEPDVDDELDALAPVEDVVVDRESLR